MTLQNLYKEFRTLSPFARKVGGFILLLTASGMAFLSGWSKYNPDTTLFATMFGTAMVLLGVGNITDIWKKK